jgi:hypothetical protein
MIYDNASISRFASRRSAVPNPSVKRSHTDASRSRPRLLPLVASQTGEAERRPQLPRRGSVATRPVERLLETLLRPSQGIDRALEEPKLPLFRSSSGGHQRPS